MSLVLRGAGLALITLWASTAAANAVDESRKLVATGAFEKPDLGTERSYQFQWGSNPNTDSVARNALSVSSAFFDLTGSFVHDSGFDNRLSRSANFIVAQFYLGSFLFATIPHELAGHYLRAKQYDRDPGFHINFPSFGGFVPFDATYEELSPDAIIRINAGGAEVSQVIGQFATHDIYTADTVPSYYGWYILNAKLFDGLIHALALDSFTDDPGGYFVDFRSELQSHPSRVDDSVGYALALTESYGLYDFIPPDSPWVYIPEDPDLYSNSFLRDQRRRFMRSYLIQLLDPALPSALYGLYRYLLYGDLEYRPLRLSVSGTTVMPAIRTNMGSIGVESYFDLHVVPEDRPPLALYYRTGGNEIDELKGGGIAVREMRLGRRIATSLEADFWWNGKTDRTGYNATGNASYILKNDLLLVGAVGYKARGGLMGKPLGPGPYGSLGLRLPTF